MILGSGGRGFSAWEVSHSYRLGVCNHVSAVVIFGYMQSMATVAIPRYHVSLIHIFEAGGENGVSHTLPIPPSLGQSPLMRGNQPLNQLGDNKDMLDYGNSRVSLYRVWGLLLIFLRRQKFLCTPFAKFQESCFINIAQTWTASRKPMLKESHNSNAET